LYFSFKRLEPLSALELVGYAANQLLVQIRTTLAPKVKRARVLLWKAMYGTELQATLTTKVSQKKFLATV
jgi:hypothetical protein